MGISISDATLSRRIAPGIALDLRLLGASEAHSRIRFATEEEIARQGAGFKLKHTPTASLKAVWMRDASKVGAQWVRCISIQEAAERLIGMGYAKGSVKTVQSKISRLFSQGKEDQQRPYIHEWARA